MYICVGGLPIIDKYATYSDNLLVSQWLAGDEHSFDTLYKRHVIFLLNLAMGKLANRSDAEDAVQDVMSQLYLYRDRIDPQMDIKGFLVVALRNRVLNMLRAATRQSGREAEWAASAPLSTEPILDELSYSELEAKLQIEIAALPEQCRKVFLLSRYENLSHKQIAAKLGISVNTVEQHIRKALRVLRERLDYHLFLLLTLGMWMW